MERTALTIGQKVRIIPEHTNKDLPAPKESIGYVRELHNKKVAGISRQPSGNEDCIYGIFYSIIHPLTVC
jgi:hypothetical protein